MQDIFDLTFSLHEIGFGILGVYFLFDLIKYTEDLKKYPINLRKNIFFLLLISVIGLTVFLAQEWFVFGPFLPIEFALLITLSFLHPKYGASFLLYALLSRPWEVFDNQLMSSMPRDLSYIVLLSILMHKMWRKEFYLRWNHASSCLLLYAVWVFLSVITSGHPTNGLYEYGNVFIKGVVLFFLLTNSMKVKSDLSPATFALVLSIFEKGIISFYKAFMTENLAAGARLESIGILENSNDIAAIFILAIPLSFSLFRGIKLKSIRFFLNSFFSIFYLVLIWKAKSRGALIGVGCIVMAYFFLKVQKKWIKVVSVLLVGMTIVLASNLIKRDGSDLDGSTSNRMIYWKAGVNMAIRNPLFGVGLAGYPLYFGDYAIDGNLGSEGKLRTIHSNWLLPMAESGLPGFFFYICFWAFGHLAIKRQAQSYPEFYMAFFGYAGTITFLSHTYLLYAYILIALILMSDQLPLRSKNESHQRELA